MKNNLQEIENVEGLFKVEPQMIMYKFYSNSNFMYCEDYRTGKIVKEVKL